MSCLKTIIKYLFYSFCVYFIFMLINLMVFKFPDNNLAKLEYLFLVCLSYIPVIITCIISIILAYRLKDLSKCEILLGGILGIGGELLIYLIFYISLGLFEKIYNLNYLNSGIYTFCSNFILMYLVFLLLIFLLKHSKSH